MAPSALFALFWALFGTWAYRRARLGWSGPFALVFVRGSETAVWAPSALIFALFLSLLARRAAACGRIGAPLRSCAPAVPGLVWSFGSRALASLRKGFRNCRSGSLTFRSFFQRYCSRCVGHCSGSSQRSGGLRNCRAFASQWAQKLPGGLAAMCFGCRASLVFFMGSDTAARPRVGWSGALALGPWLLFVRGPETAAPGLAWCFGSQAQDFKGFLARDACA